MVRFIIVSCVLLFSCQSETTQRLPVVESPVIIPKDTSMLGKWSYSIPFYSKTITLLKNGSFTYLEQGCTGKSYSEGCWIKIGEQIVLHSYEKYMRSRDDNYDFIDTKIPLPELPVTLDSISHDTSSIDTTIKILDVPYVSLNLSTIRYDMYDTMYVYFSHEPYFVMGDTLYLLDEDRQRTNTKFARNSN